MHFARGDFPPVKAFWSITMYGTDLFFTANPINRYAIGDDTAALHYGADGSLDIYIQHSPPVGHDSNWLPAPAGAFVLIMRLYLPENQRPRRSLCVSAGRDRAAVTRTTSRHDRIPAAERQSPRTVRSCVAANVQPC